MNVSTFGFPNTPLEVNPLFAIVTETVAYLLNQYSSVSNAALSLFEAQDASQAILNEAYFAHFLLER